MNKTTIPWVKNPDGSPGYTSNPISGCENHTPEGLCLDGLFPCYAYKLANGRLKQRYLHDKGWKINYDPSKEGYREACLDPFYPRFWEERLDDLPIATGILEVDGCKLHKGIFVCDMGDLFGVGVPKEWTQKVLDRIKRSSIFHRFYLLTKQPRELFTWSPFPENCWVGVTATGPQAFHEAEVHLANIEAPIKFVSIEPMLMQFWVADIQPYVDWLIIGACTGTKEDMLALTVKQGYLTVMPWGKKWTAQPKIEWLQEIVAAADKAGIPVFQKNNLIPLLGAKLRQELPK